MARLSLLVAILGIVRSEDVVIDGAVFPSAIRSPISDEQSCLGGGTRYKYGLAKVCTRAHRLRTLRGTPTTCPSCAPH